MAENRTRLRQLFHAVLSGLAELLTGGDQPVSWPRERLRWLKWTVRIVVAVGTAVLYAIITITTDNAYPNVATGIVVLIAFGQLLPLPLTVRYPLWGWRIGMVAALLVPLLPGTSPWGNWPWEPAQIPLLGLVFVVVGLRHRRALLWWMWAFMLLALWWQVPDSGDATGGTVVFTVGTVLVDTIAGRLRTQRALRAQTELGELEKARRTVLEERARIARELHDVVAHHMSLIAVQAETAPYRLGSVPDEAAGEFASISAQARRALQEMRRLLGVLRSEETAARAPQPGLAELDGLVAGIRRAGVCVRSALRGTDRPVPDAVGVCVYRVVQEALSNATRHAAGSDIDLSVTVTAVEVAVRVENGPGAGPKTAVGPTHGLVGMRERVSLLGGELTTGPTSEGGFAVTATVPVRVAETRV